MKGCRLLLLATMLLPGAGCSRDFAMRDAMTVKATELPRAADPLNHLVYVGSSGGYHYFHHSQMKAGGSYRVLQSEIDLPRTFPLGTRDRYVVFLDAQGKPLRRSPATTRASAA